MTGVHLFTLMSAFWPHKDIFFPLSLLHARSDLFLQRPYEGHVAVVFLREVHGHYGFIVEISRSRSTLYTHKGNISALVFFLPSTQR